MPIVFVINDSEVTAGTRGSSLGSRAIEIEALKKNDNVFQRTKTFVVTHENNSLYDRIRHPLAKRIHAFSKVFADAAEKVSGVVQKGGFPLVISGDHGNAAGTIAGLKKAHPDKRIGAVWVDAHADLHSPYTTPSGNMHGMPLAIALGEDNLECQQNDPEPETLKYWNELKNYGEIPSKIKHSDIVFFGVRDVEEPEVQLMQRHEMRNFTVSEVTKKGAAECVKEALGILAECDFIYLSFDVDSMDPQVVSKGTGTPVNDGFTPEMALDILKHFIASGKLCGLEIVEVNPLLDNKGNEMARVAYLILKELIQAINTQLNS